MVRRAALRSAPEAAHDAGAAGASPEAARAALAGLPPVTVVDLRAELRAGNASILSETLRVALEETLERGEQAIMFLNRRGTATAVICRECGYTVALPALRCVADLSRGRRAGRRADLPLLRA